MNANLRPGPHGRWTYYPTDNAGKHIRPGSNVAYNRSGEVELGVVTKVGFTPQGVVREMGPIHIKNNRDQQVSKVRRGACVAVLDKQ